MALVLYAIPKYCFKKSIRADHIQTYVHYSLGVLCKPLSLVFIFLKQTFDVGAHDTYESTSHLKTSSSCPAIRSTAGRPVGRVKQEFINPDSEEYQDLERRKKELHNNSEMFNFYVM